jgi:lipoprotein-releasing system permease protein
MLATMGASPAVLRQTFVLLGGLVAGAGMLLGVALGVGSAWVLDRYHLVEVPGRVYFLDYVPFRVEAQDLLFVVLVTGTLALFASAYAAQKAAALDPVEALQR